LDLKQLLCSAGLREPAPELHAPHHAWRASCPQLDRLESLIN
jgi:hypothetical protein